MIDPLKLEETYDDFIKNLKKWAPDGILTVDLFLLDDLGLLGSEELNEGTPEDVTEHFHVIETDEKITLYNEQFAIWIVPKIIDGIATTYTYIALVSGEYPQLELVYSTSGVYNTPRYILKVLQHFLVEMIDTEAVISSIRNDG
jgi:hypothetical protein